MSGFIQNVFDAISLERNPKLWTSEDPALTKKRISLLSEFEETRFSELIERKKTPIGKNDLLANAFLSKPGKDAAQRLGILNQSLVLASDEKLMGKIVAERARILFQTGNFEGCSNDLDWLSSFKSLVPEEVVIKFKSCCKTGNDEEADNCFAELSKLEHILVPS